MRFAVTEMERTEAQQVYRVVDCSLAATARGARVVADPACREACCAQCEEEGCRHTRRICRHVMAVQRADARWRRERLVKLEALEKAVAETVRGGLYAIEMERARQRVAEAYEALATPTARTVIVRLGD